MENRKAIAVLETLSHLTPTQKEQAVRSLEALPPDKVKKALSGFFRTEGDFVVQSGKMTFFSDGEAAVPSRQTVENVRTAGEFLNELLTLLREAAVPGIATAELELMARAYVESRSLGLPTLSYEDFPYALGVSVNGRVVHAPPGKTPLTKGDLVTIDCVLSYQGAMADAAVAFVVGGGFENPRSQKLVEDSRRILLANLDFLTDGAILTDFALGYYCDAVAAGYRVVRNCSGHGVGTALHEFPWIYHWPNTKTDATVLRKGQIITVEPIVTFASDYVRYGADQVGTLSDSDVGAYWECTLLITDGKPEILAGIVS